MTLVWERGSGVSAGSGRCACGRYPPPRPAGRRLQGRWLRRGQRGDQRRRGFAEALQFLRAQRLRAGQLHGLRISVHAADQVFIVQVGAGGESGHPHVADDIALLHARADMHISRETRHVTVQRRDIGAVGENDGIAVAAALACEADMAVAGGVHRRAGGRRVVGAHVTANQIQDRVMPMRIERRTHPREFDRRAQERLAHRQAVRRVVAARCRCPQTNRTARYTLPLFTNSAASTSPSRRYFPS